MDKEALYKKAIEDAQAILLRYLPPGGLPAERAIAELFHVLDHRDLLEVMRS